MADTDTIDDYELLDCIVTGNATQVWEVRKVGASQSMAMKLLLPEAFKDSALKSNLKHEAAVGKSLEHPNIIRVQDVKFTRNHGYMVMEYFRGSNIKSMIRNNGPLVKAKAKRIVECLAQALAYMHDKKWVHKDVKPENVLMTKGGEVRLIDFSLAGRAGNQVVHALSKKKNIVIQGTRTYLAPELIRRERLTHSVDIYSLGVMIYEMLTGNPPFRTANPNDLLMMHVRDIPGNPSEIDDNITPEADKFVLKLLSKYPQKRPANMHEVFAEVRNINFFKVDPIEHARAQHAAFLASDAQAQNDRLDSRMDAKRTAEGGPRPAPKPKPKPKAPPPEPVKAAAKKTAAQPPAQPPSMPQQPMPQQPMPGQYPGMGYPGMPMPGYPMQPGMQPGMPPGYPMQPGMQFPGYPGMPGGPMPPGGFPGMPGQPMPGQPMPGQPMPGQQMPRQQMPGQQIPGQQIPGQPMPGQPQPGSPGAPQPGAPRPAAPPTPPGSAPQPSAPPKLKEEPEDAPMASIDDLDIE